MNSSKKISIFLPFFADGGMERAMINLAAGLIERGIEVDLLLFTDWNSPLLNQIPSKVKIISLNSNNIYFALPKVVAYIRREKPDYTLSLSTPVNIINIFAKLFLLGRPKIMVSTQVAIQLKKTTTRFKAFFRPFIYRLYNLADIVHAVSKGVAKDLESFGVKKNKIQVIYNPIISPEILMAAMEPVTHPWLVDKSTPVLLGLGRLVPQKDFPTLLKAFALAREKINLRLIILGEGEKRDTLTALSEDLGIKEYVSLPGFDPNPYVYLKHADLFVLSSVWEGFGNVVAEALAIGTPIVSTDCPHGPREILEDGKYGELVLVGDESALAQAILRVLSNPTPTELLQAGAQRFSIAHITEEYISAMQLS